MSGQARQLGGARRLTPVTEYGPGKTIHWIQARKAWEDNETWKVGTLEGVDGELIRVRFPDETVIYWSQDAKHAADYLDGGGRRVVVTDRWRILAIPSMSGNVIGLSDEWAPGSVFALTESPNPRFIGIDRRDDA